MSITIDSHTFKGPFSSPSQLENKSGVYAIFCPSGANKCRIIDVGEAAKVRDRVEGHDRKSCWERNGNPLMYGVHYTPGKQQAGRKEIEQAIRASRTIPCGER